jgi:leucyl aminopeptidase
LTIFTSSNKRQSKKSTREREREREKATVETKAEASSFQFDGQSSINQSSITAGSFVFVSDSFHFLVLVLLFSSLLFSSFRVFLFLLSGDNSTVPVRQTDADYRSSLIMAASAGDGHLPLFATPEDVQRWETLKAFLERPRLPGLEVAPAEATTASVLVPGPRSHVNDALAALNLDEAARDVALWKFSKRSYLKLKNAGTSRFLVARRASSHTDVPVPSGDYSRYRLALPPGTYLLQDDHVTFNDLVSWAACGYSWFFGKSQTRDDPSLELPTLQVPATAPAAAWVPQALIMAAAITTFRDVLRTRTNQFSPAVGALWMADLAQRYGATVHTYWTEAELRSQFLLAYEVGKGSKVDPPNVTILEWTPRGVEPKYSLDLVGKGVCFDTGGHNLKTSADGAACMYADKGGAVAQTVLAELIMKHNLPIKLRLGNGWVVNVPGAFATMQSSIHRVSDLTVENGNTDAEGRLVMGSILAHFAAHQPADITITHATLTGAILTGLSEGIAAMYVDDPELRKVLKRSMRQAQDPVWHMPRDSRLKERLKRHGDADIRSTGHSYGGSLNADAFLTYLAAPSTKFVHIDAACALKGTSGITSDVSDLDIFAVRGFLVAFQQLAQ